jgi:hypothetical protein
MRKLIGGAVLLASLVGIPAVAAAQHSDAKHEFGVDIGIMYSKPDQLDGVFQIGTPVDVRVGFVSSGSMMLEPRFSLLFLSGSGSSATLADLGLNVLFGKDQRAGMYFTAGGSMLLASGGGTSATGFSVNGGIGTRSGYGSGALRLEAFVKYDLESTDLGRPNTLNIGARVGLSLWH